MKTVKIIGIGLGNSLYLTQKAKDEIQNAQEIITTENLAKRLEIEEIKLTLCSVREIARTILSSKAQNIAVLVSGDVGFFSLSKTINNQMSEIKQSMGLDESALELNMEYINGISSMQYFFAKIQKNYDDIKIVTAHGKNLDMVALASYNHKVFALTGGENTVTSICKKLTQSGLGDIEIIAGEKLGSVEERIIAGNARAVSEMKIDSLSVMFIQNPDFVESATMLRDEDFERAKVPMTKEEIRWTSVNKLDIKPSHIVYDIGAGTGSVTMDMAKKACESTVYAIEKNKEACELIQKNIKKTGCFNINLSHGNAPELIDSWPAPDRVFIGGSSGNLRDILIEITKKKDNEKKQIQNETLKIVINTVTIETLVETFSCLKEIRFENIQYLSMTTAKSQKMGNYNLMVGANPVYIITAEYKGEK